MTKVFFGKIADMVAEVGALDMGADLDLAYRYAVLPDDGATNFATEFYPTKADAKARAKEIVAVLGGKIAAI